MKNTKDKKSLRLKRHKKIRAVVHGTAERPRLSVFKSSQHIYAQIINDEKGVTLVSAFDKKEKKGKKQTKTERAIAVGETIAKQAVDLKIHKVVFDRGGFPYSGRIKALGNAAREKGLEF